MKKILFFVLLLFAVITGCASRTNQSPITKTGFALDTVISITIYDSDKTTVLDHCMEMCSTYENLFSATLENSEIWRINHSQGKSVDISYETAQLICDALYYCELSNGVLDITMRPISEEWDIKNQMGKSEYYIPSNETLSTLMKHVNYRDVILTNKTGEKINPNIETVKNGLDPGTAYSVTLSDPAAAIDLGFIAKGYIADQLKAYLLAEGIDSGVISLGGNILLIGSKPDGSDFTVGIRKPFGAPNDTITALQESNVSVVSSGCYERYFIDEADKTIYHHIFDTTTGSPVQNDLIGVTIISDSSLEGDALSTYCYILGLNKGLAYIQSRENIKAVFITKDYELIRSFHT